jgi:hypothetical protein
VAKAYSSDASKRQTMGDSLRRLSSHMGPAKARKVLKDGKARGKALTPKQKRLFGALAGRGRE